MAATPYEEQLEPVVHRIAAEVPIEGPVAQRFIEPSLSKIPRQLWEPSVPSTTIGASFVRTILTVPDGELWMVDSLNLRYLATATVGSRSIELILGSPSIAVSSNRAPWRSRNLVLTASQSGVIFVLRFLGYQDTTNVVGNVALREGWPDFILTPGWNIGIQDFSSTDAADTFTLDGAIERFTPRGLARNEIPMGLESGFMWDLADPRKVD